MKSPRKRRGARAAALSTRRAAPPGRRRQIRHRAPAGPGTRQRPGKAGSTRGAREGCGVSGSPLRTALHHNASGHPK